jgi:hypothetical protein
MTATWRLGAVVLGLGMIAVTGCDKNATSGGGGTTSAAGGTDNKGGGGGTDSYGKKLVGVWEGKERFGDKEETMTMEFKADGAMKMVMGPFEMKGTYKVTKEDGKVVTIDTEMSLEGFGDPKDPPKTDKKTLTATFEDANTMVMQKTGDKPDPLKLKRKT